MQSLSDLRVNSSLYQTNLRVNVNFVNQTSGSPIFQNQSFSDLSVNQFSSIDFYQPIFINQTSGHQFYQSINLRVINFYQANLWVINSIKVNHYFPTFGLHSPIMVIQDLTFVSNSSPIGSKSIINHFSCEGPFLYRESSRELVLFACNYCWFVEPLFRESLKGLVFREQFAKQFFIITQGTLFSRESFDESSFSLWPSNIFC